jgi:hypothetical protein
MGFFCLFLSLGFGLGFISRLRPTFLPPPFFPFPQHMLFSFQNYTINMVCLKKQKINEYLPRLIPIREFYDKRDKVLVIRSLGGLGDILMHRMIFEDFKRILPNIEITFACPQVYHEAVVGHPFVDKVIDSKTVNLRDYIISYNTSTACGTYERKIAPLSDKHRSDIWANHCGVHLTNHNMHINLQENIINYGKERTTSFKKGPLFVLCPISAMRTKNLLPWQTEVIINKIKSMNGSVFYLHTRPIPELDSIGVSGIYGIKVSQWMGILNAVDYIISTDSAAFHFAAGINKPVLGIFTFADGKVYGKYHKKFILVQKHRDDGNWECGPCYNFGLCPKSDKPLKPCLTEITAEMLTQGIDKLIYNYPIK